MAGGWLGDRAYEGVTGSGNKDGVKQKLERKIKAQEAAQKAAVQGGNFEDIITRFSSAVSKFEKGVASGLFGTLGQQEQEQENTDDLGETPNTSYDGEPEGLPEESYSAEGGELPSQTIVTGKFGEQRKTHTHAGVDYVHPNDNAPVSVIQPGIIDTGYEGGYGNWVAVKHNNGAETFYGHLSKVMVTKGQRIEAGTVIGNQGNTGRSKGAHVHFEYRPGGPGTNPVDGRGVADSYFRFGGQVKAKKNNKATDTQEKLKPVDTNYPQKKPEEFFKGTPQEKIFKDSKLKEEFSGKATTPEVKAAQTKYNEYVNQIKQQRTQQASAQMVAPAPPSQVPQIQQYPSYSQSQFYIIDRPSVIAMGGGGGSSQPVYIPVGGGDGGGTTTLPGPSEGQVVNSLIKTLLLTNLSAS
jgi:murein DD-endopeptidase MepM/ murein hydrolase activator NlpD